MTRVKHLLSVWKRTPAIGGNFEYFHITPAQPGEYSPFPEGVHHSLISMLRQNGIEKFYRHQGQAVELIEQGKNVVIATGTASGKTWCYNLPVLNSCLNDISNHSLYLFPTKSLAQDQYQNLQTICQGIYALSGVNIKASIYDGDTPSNARALIRETASILLTNPDMLHIGILPHHTLWVELFKNLQFVIIDEIHLYRGVFGSHFSNLIRRLKRIANFYGANPQFILTSATIANPVELASKLIELPVEIIKQDNAPKGEKNFIFYNPPIIYSDIGLRRSALDEVVNLVSDLVDQQVQSILFCRTRRTVENVIIRLRQKYPLNSQLVRGYRSGYLPAERREIERDLRSGKTLVVAATNALELGIDIGNLDCVILVGYPGTIAAVIQQTGRAGRRSDASLSIFLATNSPLDQFLMKHPEYVFERSPELALIDPDNLLILLQHLKCALFELPFREGDPFGGLNRELLAGLLQILLVEQYSHRVDQSHYWISDKYPANQMSLRAASGNVITLQVLDGDNLRTIGEVDQSSAMWMIHPQAIYIHEGMTYQVSELDIERHRAFLSPYNGDYYTEPTTNVEIEILNILKKEEFVAGNKYYGEVVVKSQVTGFQQILWFSQERLAQYPLEMPETQLRTTAFWIEIIPSIVDLIRSKGLWKSDRINYGPDWDRQRRLTRERDRFTCQLCGLVETDSPHHIHHKTPFRQFRTSQDANRLENLITLCPACHHRAEVIVRMRSGLSGLSYILHNLAPLYVMCDSGDLGVFSDPQSSFSEDSSPVIFLYEQIPGGVGLGEALFRYQQQLLTSALEQVQNCTCMDGCPACVGPAGENGVGGKLETIALLQALNGLEIIDDGISQR
jgi:DEAD/DEAH box helicase domain-containing protein